MDFLIGFESERLGYGKVVLQNPYKLGLLPGITVVFGDNGAGKTTFATILEKGRFAYGNRLKFSNPELKVKLLSFSDIHSLSGMEVQYYHQRMEATMNDYVPTVATILGEKVQLPEWKLLSAELGLHDVTEKKVNYLSSGELRKLLIINALLDTPDVLILDNPYIGLDAPSRDEFDKAMKRLRDRGVSIVMLLCDNNDIPGFTDSVLIIKDRVITSLLIDGEEISELRRQRRDFNFDSSLLPPRPSCRHLDHNIAFAIRNGHIRYGDREIFHNLNWCVKRGESWVLTGANGSGKSLLLSLVCADNPQAYANDITLFDRKRGSGESIWEIKDSIGYVSPEMQLYFKSNSSILEIVVQGMRNALNKFRPASEEEIETAHRWLKIFAIDELAQRKFSELSTGEQRLVLVARAMIKQPDLLVLDEPLHGLDSFGKQRVKAVIETLLKRNASSLIFVTHYTSEIPDCVTMTKTLHPHL